MHFLIKISLVKALFLWDGAHKVYCIVLCHKESFCEFEEAQEELPGPSVALIHEEPLVIHMVLSA